MKPILTLLITIGVSVYGSAQYTLDSTFNNSAVNEFTLMAGNPTNASVTAYGPDGSHYIAGRWINSMTVWKYLPDGMPDPQYGNSVFGPGFGSADLGIQCYLDVVDMEVLANDKVLVLANAIIYSQNIETTLSRIVLARFNADGSPDSTFNGDGLVYNRPLPDFEYTSSCLEVDHQTNTYYVGGYASEYGHYDCAIGIGAWFVAAYEENGDLKTGFNGNGVRQGTSGQLAQAAFSTITPFAFVHDLKLTNNGNIHAAGAYHYQDKAYFSMHLDSSGAFVSSYGVNGIVSDQHPDYYFPANNSTSVRILDNHDFIIQSYSVYWDYSGANNIPDTLYVKARKVSADGVPDLTFGTNGLLSFMEYVNNVHMDIDLHGRLIYAWGDYDLSGGQTVAFRRYMPNGELDVYFGSGGLLVTEPVANDSYLNPGMVRDIRFREDNLDMTVVLTRSATYAPNTFRVVNYAADTSASILAIHQPEIPSTVFGALYPNPTSGSVMLESGADGTYTVYSTTGVVLASGTVKKGWQTFSLGEAQKQGMVLVRLTDDEGRNSVQRIILQ